MKKFLLLITSNYNTLLDKLIIVNYSGALPAEGAGNFADRNVVQSKRTSIADVAGRSETEEVTSSNPKDYSKSVDNTLSLNKTTLNYFISHWIK